MFFSTQKNGFPFQLPNMNGQMPFMPFPFPLPFNNQPSAEQSSAEEEGNKEQQNFNPFNWCQMPQMEQYQELFKNMFPVYGLNNPCFNPFAWCQPPQMPQMEQYQEMFKNMFPWCGANNQNINPFNWCQMPQMEQYQELFKNMFPIYGLNSQCFNPFAWCQSPKMPKPEEVKEWFEKMLCALGVKTEDKANGLPFGLPIKFLQILLNMNSTPDGLSKFQKILDMIFEAYSKTETDSETAANQETAEEVASPEEENLN